MVRQSVRLSKRSAAPAVDDDPWGFGTSDGVLVDMRPESPPAVREDWSFEELSIRGQVDPLGQPPRPTKSRLAIAMLATVAASLVIAAATWTTSRQVELELPAPRGLISVPTNARPEPGLVDPAAAPATPLADVTPPSAGVTAPTGPLDVAYGAVAFDAPFDLGVYQHGRFLGAVESTPLRLSAGRHTVELVNERLGFRSRHTIDVQPDRVTRRAVEHPTAPTVIEVQPPAEVLIDDRAYGEVSRVELDLPLGTRIVVVRHPTLGERLIPVSVTLAGANRLRVDLER